MVPDFYQWIKFKPTRGSSTVRASAHVVPGLYFLFELYEMARIWPFWSYKMAISNDSTQEIWEGIWGWSGFTSLLQFPGNSHPECSDDPKCTASAGHSCHSRGIMGRSLSPGDSPHACPMQFPRGRRLHRVSLLHLLQSFLWRSDRPLSRSPQDS